MALTPQQRDAITNEVKDYLAAKGVSASRLARDAGVVQPFVWCVTNGRFQVETQRLRRLLQYIRMTSKTSEPADDGLQASIARYLSAGGDLSLLRSSVDMLSAVFEAERGGGRRAR
ncbi:hypothetical protein MFUR16E_12625 [Methylobacterium fujisawaense]